MLDGGPVIDGGLALPHAPEIQPAPAPAPRKMQAMPEKMAPEMMKRGPFDDDAAGINNLPATRPTKSYKATPTSGKSAAVKKEDDVTRVAHVDAPQNGSALRPVIDMPEEDEGRPASFVHVPSRPVKSSTTSLPVNPLRR
jgi:hypothetical protein